MFLWASLQGEQLSLDYDAELLYVGAMFHDLGLLEGHRSEHERFEIDGANAARAFLERHGLHGSRLFLPSAQAAAKRARARQTDGSRAAACRVGRAQRDELDKRPVILAEVQSRRRGAGARRGAASATKSTNSSSYGPRVRSR